MIQNFVRLRSGKEGNGRATRIAQVGRPFAPFPLRHAGRLQRLEAGMFIQQRPLLGAEAGKIRTERAVPVVAVEKRFEQLAQQLHILHLMPPASRSDRSDSAASALTAWPEHQLRRGMQRIEEQPAGRCIRSEAIRVSGIKRVHRAKRDGVGALRPAARARSAAPARSPMPTSPGWFRP